MNEKSNDPLNYLKKKLFDDLNNLQVEKKKELVARQLELDELFNKYQTQTNQKVAEIEKEHQLAIIQEKDKIETILTELRQTSQQLEEKIKQSLNETEKNHEANKQELTIIIRKELNSLEKTQKEKLQKLYY
jgi:hypothetical protein